MAATSTNKQPLLVDRVMHRLVQTDSAAAGAIDIAGTNTAVVLVDGSQADGCIIESIYAISRGTTPHKVNLYMSQSNDYLRPGEGIYVGGFNSALTSGETTAWENAPKILAPVAQAGDVPTSVPSYTSADATIAPVAASGKPLQFRAFYLPKGFTLWVARESTQIATDGPIVGAQGGWY